MASKKKYIYITSRAWHSRPLLIRQTAYKVSTSVALRERFVLLRGRLRKSTICTPHPLLLSFSFWMFASRAQNESGCDLELTPFRTQAKISRNKPKPERRGRRKNRKKNRKGSKLREGPTHNITRGGPDVEIHWSGGKVFCCLSTKSWITAWRDFCAKVDSASWQRCNRGLG